MNGAPRTAIGGARPRIGQKAISDGVSGGPIMSARGSSGGAFRQTTTNALLPSIGIGASGRVSGSLNRAATAN